MAMEWPPVRVEKRSILVIVAVRLLSSIDKGERRRTRRCEVPDTEVGRSGRAISCVFRVVSAKAFSNMETRHGIGSCSHP